MLTKNKVSIFFILTFIILAPFTFYDSGDEINPPVLSDSTIGYYQSTTCEISLIEFYIKNFNKNLNLYFNNNDYADLKCYGKITGLDKLGDSYMVSIGTNTSITLILQSTIWLIFVSLIPKADPNTKLSSKFLFCLPLLLIFQFFSEDRFYSKSNIMHNTEITFDNYYLMGNFIFLLLCSYLLFDILKNKYLNLTNYLPFIFLIVGTYSGMNLNFYLIVLSFFGIQNLVINKKIYLPDVIYFGISLIWLSNINSNNYFFDGDKLRGFTNSSYSFASQVFWIVMVYLLLKGLIFLIKESIEYFDIKVFINNSLISGSLILFFGVVGSISPLFNFFNFFIFGQNKRGMKELTSIAGNTWRGFSASAESIGEFYGLIILMIIFYFINSKNNLSTKHLVLLIPVAYGLYRSNNFAAFSSLIVISLSLFVIKTNFYRRYKIYVLLSASVLFLVLAFSYLYFADYPFLSTELIYEATLHQNFYPDPNSDTSYYQVEKKMIERDLKTLLYDETNYPNASKSYIFLVESFTQTFNIPYIPHYLAVVSAVSLAINRTEMWGIFIAKYNPTFVEAIFGSGPFQLNKYLYGHDIKLDVPNTKLQALFLPHSSFLDLLLFIGAGGVFLLGIFVIYLFLRNKNLSFYKIGSIYLLINLLKSDSILYINSFILIFFIIINFYYLENVKQNE